MKELFEIQPCDSPRLKWMKKHEIKTAHLELDDECVVVCVGNGERAGMSLDAEYAILDWAKKNRVKLWNEE